ncbi:MAG: hypothetical protein K6E40_13480 [Desulfovibrio sp.]|nr:hypothetical protein [Desulfovibrio sp.]
MPARYDVCQSISQSVKKSAGTARLPSPAKRRKGARAALHQTTTVCTKVHSQT